MELKLGKLPPVIDHRTIPLRAVLRTELLPELPLTYDIDEVLDIEDDFVFNNSKYGDCVIASRAHQTLRFEKYEQGVQIPITDQEVVDEYFDQTGGADRGLILLTSIKDWRNDGWPVGGRNYTIYAFASVDWLDHDEVKHCIHLLNGVNFGMKVFQTDLDQFNAGEGWHLTDNSGYLKGRHGVYACKYRDINNGIESVEYPGSSKVVSYSQDGVWAMTWGRKQFMTWDFWDARVDEAYGIVDNKNKWLGDDSPVDVQKLDAYLQEITKGRGENSGCAIPFLGKAIRFLLKGLGW
jgi:hypothetical protein